MPRGTSQAYLTTDAAILPTPPPLPSIEPGRARMGNTPPVSFWMGSDMNQGTDPRVVRVPGGGSICARGKKISADVVFAMRKEMAVGGLTAEALRCLGSYDFLISHAHGHAKRPAIRSLNSAR